MSARNTAARYGSVAKTLHWLTALLILTAIPLGVIANNLPFDTGEALARKAFLFSLHKTIGVSAFFVALARIIWAITQPKPGLLNADHKVESFLAETIHWALYASLVLVPLSGWLHHAASTGFAPIYWPFGQDLPLVPKSEGFSALMAGVHVVVTKVLALSVLLHIAGAVKHHVIDKDATLRRMLPGRPTLPQIATHAGSSAPIVAAVAMFVVALGIGSALGVYSAHSAAAPTTPTLDAVASDWTVQDGTIEITVSQFGSDVSGQFADWTAAISFAEDPVDGVHGMVEVTIAIGSLTLGSVTSEALGADFFDAAQFPTATFNADIRAAGQGYVAEGVLRLKGAEQPVALPFTLQFESDSATMSGTTELERLPFGIGTSYADSSTVGLTVTIDISLTATRP